MSLLVHSNTVRVFDFGEDEDGWLFLAMELLEGELLTSWIEREGTPPIPDAIRVTQEILRSLSEAHSKGIIHRDLKPDNIYLARVDGHATPVVKVLDFGIAKAFREDYKIDQLETQAGTVFGTPRYMSPEQAQGKALDHRSDLYSVGVLLYQLLTGNPPFLDDDAVVVMAKHIREKPKPVCEVVPDRPIPRSLEKLVVRAMEKDPDKRVSSAEELANALGACLPDVEDAMRFQGAARWRALRAPLAIGAGLIAVALAIATTLVIASQPGDPPGDVVSLPREDPATPPAAQPPSGQAPAPSNVLLRSDPEGAEIYRGDERVGTTPYTFTLASSETASVTVRAEGYEPLDVALSAASGPERRVSLERARAAVRRPPREAPPPSSPSPPEPTPPRPGDPYERFD
jgi:serine/threonine-protein kinase